MQIAPHVTCQACSVKDHASQVVIRKPLAAMFGAYVFEGNQIVQVAAPATCLCFISDIAVTKAGCCDLLAVQTRRQLPR